MNTKPTIREAILAVPLPPFIPGGPLKAYGALTDADPDTWRHAQSTFASLAHPREAELLQENAALLERVGELESYLECQRADAHRMGNHGAN